MLQGWYGSGGGGGGSSGPPNLRRQVEAVVASNRKGLNISIFDGGIMDALSQLMPAALQVQDWEPSLCSWKSVAVCYTLASWTRCGS